MFFGMTVGLVMHFIVLKFRIPFPGYDHSDYNPVSTSDSEITTTSKKTLPLSMYGLLVIPSLFDLVATALCMFGLRYVNVSVYQMLRGILCSQ